MVDVDFVDSGFVTPGVQFPSGGEDDVESGAASGTFQFVDDGVEAGQVRTAIRERYRRAG